MAGTSLDGVDVALVAWSMAPAPVSSTPFPDPTTPASGSVSAPSARTRPSLR
ncbi:MAG: hypothetical protein U5L11_13560 [Arhodomonas sp.]|nr:hypothetical protein [Arhodomonas sp.]